MAKKSAAVEEKRFNLTQALRDVHAAHPEWGPNDMVQEIKRLHPEQDVNENTAKATASTVRSGGKKGAGLSGGAPRARATTDVTVKDIETALAFAKDHFKGSIDESIEKLESLLSAGDIAQVLKALKKAKELQGLLVGRK